MSTKADRKDKLKYRFGMAAFISALLGVAAALVLLPPLVGISELPDWAFGSICLGLLFLFFYFRALRKRDIVRKKALHALVRILNFLDSHPKVTIGKIRSLWGTIFNGIEINDFDWDCLLRGVGYLRKKGVCLGKTTEDNTEAKTLIKQTIKTCTPINILKL